jgi:hypothetical protein
MNEQVANPLTLVMTIKSKDNYEQLKALLQNLQSQPAEKNPITVALDELSTVHFARFVFLNERQLAVITTYDGSFERYIDAFVNKIGKVFDMLLEHMVDAPSLPVESNREEFLQYVEKNDLKCVGTMYCAYPNSTVVDILTMERQRTNG